MSITSDVIKTWPTNELISKVKEIQSHITQKQNEIVLMKTAIVEIQHEIDARATIVL